MTKLISKLTLIVTLFSLPISTILGSDINQNYFKLTTSNGLIVSIYNQQGDRIDEIWCNCIPNKYDLYTATIPGEIDIMENVGYDPDTIVASAHTLKYNHSIGTERNARIVCQATIPSFSTIYWNGKRMNIVYMLMMYWIYSLSSR